MVVSGAPVVGTVKIKDSSTPARTSFSAVNADGSYTLNITDEWQSPFLLWIDGHVNNQHVRMLSCFEVGAQEQSVTVNITPATTAIVAAAMGDEVDNIDPETASPPDQSTVDAIQEHVQDALEDVFAVFDLDESFDLFETPIDALGEGSDEMFEVLSISTDNSDNIVVNDRVDDTATVSIDQNGNTSGNITELVNTATESQIALDEIRNVLELWYSLYETSRPDEATLTAQLRPKMAEGYIHNGYDRDDIIELYATDDTTGIIAGVETLVSCAIFRPMQEQAYGNQSIHENIDDYPEALWIIGTSNYNGIHFPWLFSFVRTDQDEWKMYGNRRPFTSGGRIRSRSQKNLNSAGDIIYDTGLHIYTKDTGNMAQSLGITNIAIFNPVMPAEEIDGESTNCLRMARKNEGLSKEFGITNVSADYNRSLYRARANGDLDLTALAAQDVKEFIVIGLDDSDIPVWAYTHLLTEAPLPVSQLVANDSDYFPVITGLQSFGDIDFSGPNNFQWQIPASGDLYAMWSSIGWSDEDWNYSEVFILNTYFYETGDIYSWTTDEFDISFAETVKEAYVNTTLRDRTNHREFRLQMRHRPWVEEFVSLDQGELVFDVDHAYGAENLSDRVEARARIRDMDITRFEADIVIESASLAGEGVDVHTEIMLYYQPDEYWHESRNDQDFFEVTIRIYCYMEEQVPMLSVNGWVWGSNSEDGSIEYDIPDPVGSFPYNDPINFNEVHSVAVAYDQATTSLIIEYDGQASSIDMSSLPAFDPDNFKEARFRTRVRDIEAEGHQGQMKARIDDVMVNGQLYDDFNDGFEVNKWDINAYE